MEQVIHERGHCQSTVTDPCACDQVVHRQRCSDITSVRSHCCPTTEGRDADHSLDPLSLEGVARWSAEAHIGGLDALGVGVRGHKPEYAVCACERPGDNIEVAVRSLHDFNALTLARRQTGGITHNHADRLVVLEQVVQNLMADLTSGSCNDDHENHLQERDRVMTLACI